MRTIGTPWYGSAMPTIGGKPVSVDTSILLSPCVRVLSEWPAKWPGVQPGALRRKESGRSDAAMRSGRMQLSPYNFNWRGAQVGQ